MDADRGVLAVGRWCQHSLEVDGHWPQPMVRCGLRPSDGRQRWRCAVIRRAQDRLYAHSPLGEATSRRKNASAAGKARKKRYDGTVKGVDRTNRGMDRRRAGWQAARVAEIAAIQKRIRDAN